MVKSHPISAAAHRFHTRLAAVGVIVVQAKILSAAAELASSTNREVVLRGATTLVQEIITTGVADPEHKLKDLVLEALAAAAGLSNWSTFSARLPTGRSSRRLRR